MSHPNLVLPALVVAALVYLMYGIIGTMRSLSDQIDSHSPTNFAANGMRALMVTICFGVLVLVGYVTGCFIALIAKQLW